LWWPTSEKSFLYRYFTYNYNNIFLKKGIITSKVTPYVCVCVYTYIWYKEKGNKRLKSLWYKEKGNKRLKSHERSFNIIFIHNTFNSCRGYFKYIEEITWLTPILARKSATKFPFYGVCWKDIIQSLVHKFLMSLRKTHELWVSTTLLEIKVKDLRESNSKIKYICPFIPSHAKLIPHCYHFCLHVRCIPYIVKKSARTTNFNNDP